MTIIRAARRVRPFRGTLVAAVGLITAAALAGCGSGSSAAGASGGSGGSVTFLLDSLGSTWVPNSASFSSFQGNVFSQIYDKLVYVDDTGKVSPWIAQSWENNKDYTEFTLHLKPGVTFSDGEKLDAAAVVANLDYWAKGQPDKGIAPIGLFPKSYSGATAVDDSTVKVTFKTPTLGFIPVLGYAGSALYAPKAIQGSAQDQADLAKDIGSGPYTVKSWKADDDVVLEKRKDYSWGPAAIGNTGAAHIAQITYKVNADPAVRTAAVQSGQAQVAYNPTPQQISDLKAQGFTVYTPVYLGFSYGWALNTKTPLFSDEKVRQAVQHGIDREEIIKTVYTPDWKAARSFFNDTVPGVADESAEFAYDPTQAGQLLQQDGWTKGSDGVLTKGGQKLELTLYANPYLPTSKQVDQLIATQLGKLGFKVNVQAYDVITYGDKVKQNAANVAAYETTRSIGDASTAANVFTDANQGENWFNLGESDKTIDRLRDSIASATDPAQRDKDLAALQQHVLQQAYYIPITQIVQRPLLTSPKLKDVVEDSTAFPKFAAATIG
ncbi:ABC transporter substrate-binding protein [Nocardioides sp. BP30]|uniref:ABC transporter substrate-binding protein n=1 Tax=Nocardioides sp. BP30 TaxID=3036374 RepID=UPI002469180F|nr:ABC transporter substrate-binding protein [Nocardioides sp. BP30]WGL52029.1 ABC transporter substrate-binding protein [Nocardioides sp. BP30]